MTKDDFVRRAKLIVFQEVLKDLIANKVGAKDIYGDVFSYLDAALEAKNEASNLTDDCLSYMLEYDDPLS